MRTTLALDDELVTKAQEFTGVMEKTALVREALRALVEREASRRLAALEGWMPKASAAVEGDCGEGESVIPLMTTVRLSS